MVRCAHIVLTLAVLSACAPSSAEAPKADACLDLTKADTSVTISGKLTIQLFAGQPNYESIANGDAEERTFILELPKRMCANDEDFIDPTMPFDRVQVNAGDERLIGVLRAAVGQNVTVTGEAFGSHTGHHHAPLVMLANEVSVK